VTADDQIGTFWEWFAAVCELLPEEAATVEELDRRVSDWVAQPGRSDRASERSGFSRCHPTATLRASR
jgi:hypothetical protein